MAEDRLASWPGTHPASAAAEPPADPPPSSGRPASIEGMVALFALAAVAGAVLTWTAIREGPASGSSAKAGIGRATNRTQTAPWASPSRPAQPDRPGTEAVPWRAAPRSPDRPEADYETVYITRTGKKYHAAGCRHLSRSTIPVERDQAVKNGYTPCRVCRP